MKRPLAWRHLARLNDMLTSSSILRVVAERDLFPSPAVLEAAEADKAMAEEVMALARERGWRLPEPKAYEWNLVKGEQAGEALVLARMLRILARDVFELDGIARQTDDDDVASLALEVRNERKALHRTLQAAHPEYSVPGAK